MHRYCDYKEMSFSIRFFLVIFLVVVLLMFFFFQNLNEQTNSNVIPSNLETETKLESQSDPNVNVIDLSKPLDSEIYKKITCKKSAKYVVETTLCLHHIREHVSSYIRRYGAYEGQILGM